MRDIPSYRESALIGTGSRTYVRVPPGSRLHVTGLDPKTVMASSNTKEVSSDAASVFSTATFASTASLLKTSLKNTARKIHSSSSNSSTASTVVEKEKETKAEKEQRKKAEKEERKKRKEEESKSWGKDINGENKTPRQRTTESYMVIGMLK